MPYGTGVPYPTIAGSAKISLDDSLQPVRMCTLTTSFHYFYQLQGVAMKTYTRLFIVAVFLVTQVMLSSCGKEPVTPYVATDKNANVPEATDIEYTSPEYSYDMGPSEESLDTPSEEAAEDSGMYAMDGGADGSGMDMESDEYKKTHGRSSVEMLPIYFDFDQAAIRGDQIPRIEQNAEYLQSNPSVRVVIQGNSDNRGTNEYNLALGERRALNAKTYLIELGIDEDRIRTVSYGEERPLFTGQDEYSWAQNRRDDFVLE